MFDPRKFSIALTTTCALWSACASNPMKPVTDESAAACTEDEDICRSDKVGSASIGWLEVGLPVAEVERRLGKAPEVEEPFEEGATGFVLHGFRWPALGVWLSATPDAEGKLVVDQYSVKAPFEGMTEKGVGLGSSEDEVVKAYGDLIDPHSREPGVKLVVGSLYYGIFFTFENGRVVDIFGGRSAE